MKTRIARTTVLFALFLLLAPLANAQTRVELVNPGFEDGFHIQGRPELEIPDGWTLDARDGNHPWCRTPCHEPEVKPNQEYVTGGNYSVRSFTTYARGLYAIYQDVDVEPGSWWEFSCNVRLESNPPGQLAAFVGIQPWAGGVFDRQMIWGQETQEQLLWTRITVTAPAYGPRIRVAFGANNAWPTKNNTLWWDNCELRTAQAPGQCPECPSDGGPIAVDYSAIRTIVREELALRPPVTWPQ